MSKERFEYKNVSANAVITTEPAVLGGMVLICKTTAGVTAFALDATATATGTVVLGGGITASANGVVAIPAPGEGILCRTGIYLSAPTCTTAADQVIVYYRNL
jgi:hypothetical protein